MPMSSKRLEMLDDKLAEVQATLLTQVDGLLAGIIVCPTPVPSGEWLSVVLRTEDGEPVVFSDSKQRETLVGLLIDYRSRLVEDLDAERYQALFEVDPRNDDLLWELWAEGFMLALGLAPPEVWDMLIANPDEEAADAMAMLMTLIAISQGETPPELQDKDALVEEAPDIIPACVEVLYRGRLKTHALHAAAASERKGPKAGRNEPCPCGSGKKYKTCCGAN